MRKIKTPVCIVVFCLTFFGCSEKKERWKDKIISELPATRILSFKIENAKIIDNKDLYAAINDKDKTVTVYLPAYYAFEKLEVAIAIPEGATLSPPATELLPVFPENPPYIP